MMNIQFNPQNLIIQKGNTELETQDIQQANIIKSITNFNCLSQCMDNIVLEINRLDFERKRVEAENDYLSSQVSNICNKYYSLLEQYETLIDFLINKKVISAKDIKEYNDSKETADSIINSNTQSKKMSPTPSIFNDVNYKHKFYIPNNEI